ncbi:phytoene/squalene synthase family protein [Candidatus Saccharibacteria bacterium]|nr:phytoene/squalene synthase family protein [Candidatus Saccharibacteria bacterium]
MNRPLSKPPFKCGNGSISERKVEAGRGVAVATPTTGSAFAAEENGVLAGGRFGKRSNVEKDIFRQGSTTYYWSSRFFPSAVRDDVLRLYSFVRVVDDLVDQVPADKSSFEAIESAWVSGGSLPAGTVAARVLENIRYLCQERGIEKAWVDDFLRSMRWDLEGKLYKTIDDSTAYVYGSAEVIGLCMAKLLSLSPEANHAAQLQGRAMQWINFCRDIAEDVELGRCYFPDEDMRSFGFDNLQAATTRQYPDDFKAFMCLQLDRYDEWQREANAGFHFIPKRLRVPVQTARDMYNWTAQQIRQDPFVVYKQKVKPTKPRIIWAATKAALHG